MDIENYWKKNGFLLRPAEAADADSYFEQNYHPLDPEIAYLTGCKEIFTKEEVVSFFLNSLEAQDRCLFLIIDPKGAIIGEAVINEI